MGVPGITNNAMLMQQGQPAPLLPTGGSAHLSGVVPQEQQVPFLRAPLYDGLDARTRIKDYKEGGSSVKFEPFHGHSDRSKALTFIQQFDTAFMKGSSMNLQRSKRPPHS